MKKTLLILIGAGFIGYLASVFFSGGASNVTQNNSTEQLQQSADTQPSIKSSSIFVPYWSLKGATASDLNSYNYVIYFGVAADQQGLEKSDPGYTDLAAFNALHLGTKKYLAIRMIDTDINAAVIKDPQSQQKIIQQSIDTARQYGFDGIVFDFETSSIAFDPVTKRVTQFYTAFAKQVHSAKLPFYVTLYGDTYYRVRPYDVKTIASLSDQILVMSYDFHKAHGNPGPNFPLHGKEVYGYDFATMIDDFLHDAPKDKLTFVFGMFGYDWPVDRDGNSTDMGTGTSTLEIENTLVNTCKYSDCKITRHYDSKEQEITYNDESGQKHVVWFEDTVSRQDKENYLKSRGLNATSLWAYSYF